MVNCTAFNRARDCSLDPFADLRPLEPYADISGVGVIIGFVGTGYFALILVIINYLLAYDPAQSPWHEQDITISWRANPVDVMFLRCVRRIKENSPDPFRNRASYLQRSIEKSILRLCDIQIATGLSILTSAFILGPQCGLDAYHWQMIVHLAWFSAVTHLSGLFVLRSYIVRRQLTKLARVGLMTSLVIILFVATVPTIFFNWKSDIPLGDLKLRDGRMSPALPNSIAFCFYDLHYGVELSNRMWSEYKIDDPYCKSIFGSHQFQAALLSMVILGFGFMSRLVKLFGPLSRYFRKLIRERLSALGQSSLHYIASHEPRWTSPGLWEAAVLRPALAIFLLLRLFADLVGSMLAEVYWLICIIIWGTAKLLTTRRSIDEAVMQDEDQWTFGQILPVLLLVGPFLGILSTMVSELYKTWYLGPLAIPRPLDSIALDSVDLHTQTMREGNLEQNEINTTCHSVRLGLLQKRILESWLARDSYFIRPWMHICMAMPCIWICGFTFELFVRVFSIPDRSTNIYRLLDIWLSPLGLMFSLFVDLPTAFTGTLLLGLSLDSKMTALRRGFIKRLGFFIASMLIYGICCAPTIAIGYTVYPIEKAVGLFLEPYIFSFFRAGLLYITYLLGCIIWYVKPSPSPRALRR